MRLRRTALLPFLLLLAAAVPLHAAEDLLTTLGRESAAAYRAKQYERFLALTKQALALKPGHIQLTHNLACAEALLGHPDEAAAAAMRLLSHGIDSGILEDEDLAAVRNLPAFAPVREAVRLLATPEGTATEAFRLEERTLLTEGIAHDPKTGRFFVGSVHERKIVARAADGAVADFVPSGRGGILGILALRADPERRLLWATGAAMPEMTGFTKELEGRSELYRFDLDSGRLLSRHAIPAPGAHNVNDLTLEASGGVLVSDAVGGGLWRLPPGGKALAPLLLPGTLRSPQGLALAPGEKRLYVADYAEGLFALDLETRAVSPVAAPEEIPLAGIDALLADGPDLLVVQNGFRPHRVLRLRLDPSGLRVASATTLLRADPRFSEPTLAVIVGRDLYVVAASQWALFDPKLFAPEKLKEPLVLKIPLGAR